MNRNNIYLRWKFNPDIQISPQSLLSNLMSNTDSIVMKPNTKNTSTETTENNIDPGGYYSVRLYGARDLVNKEPYIYFFFLSACVWIFGSEEDCESHRNAAVCTTLMGLSECFIAWLVWINSPFSLLFSLLSLSFFSPT